VLDSPSPEYQGKYLKKIESIPSFGAFPELDREGVKRAELAFQSLCREKALELAAQATELDPANVDWWRLRAILLTSYPSYSRDESAVVTNWVEILDQCARHDPDNALYDYLAAYFYWESSAVMEPSGSKRQLVVKDAERFDQGVDRFARAQDKRFFAIGDAGFTAVADFLRRTSIPLVDHEQIANSRAIHLRRSLLLRDIWRWQGLRADQTAAAGDIGAALTMKRQNLRLTNQYTSTGPSTAYDDIGLALRLAAAAQLRALADQHEELLSAKELEEIGEWEAGARLARKVTQQAALLMPANQRQQPGTDSPTTVVRAMIAVLSLSLAVLLLLVGLVAIVSSRFSTNRSLPKIGALEHALLLAAAFAVTIVVFSLAPSKIIPEPVQAWTLTILVIVTPLLLAAWLAWSWLGRRAFKFSLRTMFLAMFALCLLFGLISITDPNLESFAQLPFALSIPARGWGDLDAASLENVMRSRGNWHRAVIQWTAYYGQYLTVALWATLAAALFRRKLRHGTATAENHLLAFRDGVAAFSSSLCKASLQLAALLLVVHLALMPGVVETVEQETQRKLAFARHPSNHWSEVESAVQRVQSSQDRMDELRAAVKAEMLEAGSQGAEQ
jgi:hypothetical protein